MGEASSPKTKEAWFEEAVGHFADDRLEDAVDAYRRALSLDGGYADALHGLARALRDLGRIDEAIETTRRLIEVEPDDPLAHTGLSILYNAKGMIPEAEQEEAKARVLSWKRELRDRRGSEGPSRP